MKDEELKELVRKTIEEEAEAVTRNVMENPDLDSVVMPEDSYKDLMKRVDAMENAGAEKRHFHIQKRGLVAASLAAVLLIGAGVGASGARLFVPKVEHQETKDGLGISIDNDDNLYAEITEDEAYEEIENSIGILALRLGYKPKGMELEKVYIDADMGEALLEFYYGDSILTVYENKQNDSSSTDMKIDGEKIDTVETFYDKEKFELVEFNKNDGDIFYQTQLERGNAYYYLSTDMELEEFKNIIMGIYFKSV